MGVVIGFIIWGIIWGFITKSVNESKGYDGGFLLGFFLGFIGLIVVACKPDNRYRYNQQKSTMLSSALSSAASEKQDNELLSHGGWKCDKCGAVNPAYYGTCGCGTRKSDVVKRKQKAVEEEQAKKELQNLQKLKAYKELLDSGAISEDEYNKKKSELLN